MTQSCAMTKIAEVTEKISPRVAILVRSGNHSPMILAQSLNSMLSRMGCPSEIIPGVEGIFRRKLPLFVRSRYQHIGRHRRLLEKLRFYQQDAKLIGRLRHFTHFILAETIPNAYWRHCYALEHLQRWTGSQPLALYEVFFLSAAPEIRKELEANGDHLNDRFDYHFAVTESSYIRIVPGPNEAVIGLDLANTSSLSPRPKHGFVALMDFPHPGFEEERASQLRVLRSLGIPTIILEGKYTIEEIRSHYQEASVMFLQKYESFGLPIAECLAAGCYIFTPDPALPMAFRQEPNPQPYKGGVLPAIFRVYSSESELRAELKRIQSHFDAALTPLSIFREFTALYPHFYYGNPEPLLPALAQMQRGMSRSESVQVPSAKTG